MRSDADFPLSEHDFRSIYQRVPRLTVEIVLRDGDTLVLSRRDIEPCKGQWHLPGGTVRFGESLHDAVRRVARRELGVTVEVGRLLGYIEYPDMHAAGYFGWPVGIAFETLLVGGSLRGNAEGTVAGFATLPDDTIAEQAQFIRQHVLV
jgi:ADP-ribose pyrophosphatase YjhB (NUDIX family)